MNEDSFALLIKGLSPKKAETQQVEGAVLAYRQAVSGQELFIAYSLAGMGCYLLEAELRLLFFIKFRRNRNTTNRVPFSLDGMEYSAAIDSILAVREGNLSVIRTLEDLLEIVLWASGKV